MANNIIKVTIDVVADKAATSLKGFKASLADAEGGFDKLKVAGSGAMNFMKANVAEFAVAAAGALVAFGVKAVSAFNDLALEADRFSDVTGVAVEDASRWIEVAGDVGVSGQAVQGAFQKMNKAIADGKLDEFASSIVKAKNGTVDANATFQSMVTTIGAIKDPTDRAAAAQKAFGKGYAEIAELMEMSATDLQGALQSVSDQKVIDEEEVAKAKAFRASLDTLKDKAEDLTLMLGEQLVPAAIEVAEAVSDAVGPVLELTDWLDRNSVGAKKAESGIVTFGKALMGSAVGPLGDTRDALGDLVTGYDAGEAALKEFETWNNKTGASLAASAFETRLATEATNELAEAIDPATVAYLEYQSGMLGARDAAAESIAIHKRLAEQMDDSRNAIEQMSGSVSRLKGLLSDRDAYDNAIRAQNELIWANQIAIDTAKNQKATEEEKATALDASKEALRRSIDETLTYIDTVGGIPPSQETIIKAFLDEGKLAEAEAWLAHLARARTAVITAKGQGSLGFMKNDAGGHIPSGEIHEVAEKRAEFVNGVLIAGPADVTSGAQTGRILGSMRSAPATGGGGMNIVINMPPGSNGQDVVNAIKKYERTAGPGWRS
jgi:hypothetical protein